jgi:STE24 endopeptidase
VAGFDAQAAADRYIDALSPALRAAGAAYAEQSHWAELIGGASMLVVAVLALRLGLLSRLRAELEAKKPRPLVAGAACALVLLMVAAAVRLPLDVAALVVADRTLLRPPTPLFAYLVRAVTADASLVLALAAGVTLLLALARLAPRAWWLIGGGAFSAAIVIMVWGPYAAASGPAPLKAVPPGPARQALVQLIADTGLSARQVYVVPSAEIDGDVTGVPGQARLTVDQGMLDHASAPEMRAALGHLAGHFVHGDQFGLALLMSALTVGGLAAIAAFFGPVARLAGAGGLTGVADPAGLPVWLMIGVVWLGFATVAERTYIRVINVRADQFSLDAAREPDGLAISLIRGWRDDKVDPGWLEETLFYDHPSLKSRLAHAMAWKAAHRDVRSSPPLALQ